MGLSPPQVKTSHVHKLCRSVEAGWQEQFLGCALDGKLAPQLISSHVPSKTICWGQTDGWPIESNTRDKYTLFCNRGRHHLSYQNFRDFLLNWCDIALLKFHKVIKIALPWERVSRLDTRTKETMTNTANFFMFTSLYISLKIRLFELLEW